MVARHANTASGCHFAAPVACRSALTLSGGYQTRHLAATSQKGRLVPVSAYRPVTLNAASACGLFVTGEGTGLEAWRALQGDDMVTLVKSERAAQRVMYSITLYLETTLKLKVNLVKSKVAPMSECAFQSLSFGNASLPITLRIAATALPSTGASARSIALGG